MWPGAAMPILRIKRCTRLRLTGSPSAFSIAAIRREPRNGQAVNSSSIRRIRARSLTLAGRRPQSVRCQATCTPADRQRLVGAIEHSSTVRRAHLPDLRAKKSRSTVVVRSWRAASRSRVRERPRSRARHPGRRPGPAVPEVASPGIDLVRVNLIALGQIGHPSPAPARLPARSLPSAPR